MKKARSKGKNHMIIQTEALQQTKQIYSYDRNYQVVAWVMGKRGCVDCLKDHEGIF